MLWPKTNHKLAPGGGDGDREKASPAMKAPLRQGPKDSGDRAMSFDRNPRILLVKEFLQVTEERDSTGKGIIATATREFSTGKGIPTSVEGIGAGWRRGWWPLRASRVRAKGSI